MLKLSAKCWISAFNAHRNYSSCTGSRSDNLSSSSGDAQEKKKDRVKLRKTINLLMVSWVSPPPWMLVYFFAGFFLNLTLCMTKLGVLTLCFPDFAFPGLIWFDFIWFYFFFKFIYLLTFFVVMRQLMLPTTKEKEIELLGLLPS